MFFVQSLQTVVIVILGKNVFANGIAHVHIFHEILHFLR